LNNGHNAESHVGLSGPDGLGAGQFPPELAVHPAWRAFLRFCSELKHGEIERLKIQDGLPVLAEVTKKKVKFGS
jgi:hypothetical protein